MTSWPTLPDPLSGSFNETAPDNVIRSNMDKGPDKIRRRTTANVRQLSFGLLLDATDLATLDTFYGTYSATEFDYTHPRTAGSVTARFTAPPGYKDVGGGYYRVEIALEIMP